MANLPDPESAPHFEALCDYYHQAVFDAQKARQPFDSHLAICAELKIDPNGIGATIRDYLHDKRRIISHVQLGDRMTPFGLEHPPVDYHLICA